jgi:transketolase
MLMQLRHEPAVLVLSRQPLPTLDRRVYAEATGAAQGAYVLAEPPGGNPEVILIASGSELSLAVDAVEQASTFGWERYVGSSGHIVGMRTFGASAPLKALQEKFGFEPEQVAAAAKELLGKR